MGNDTVYGGSGNNVIAGREGNDLIYGESGNNLLFGNTGDDTLVAGQERVVPSSVDKITISFWEVTEMMSFTVTSELILSPEVGEKISLSSIFAPPPVISLSPMSPWTSIQITTVSA